ncbi:MAG: hypothetical protein AAF959_10830, partial [Cyanobacteria bacterium P01_D01_bin.56]
PIFLRTSEDRLAAIDTEGLIGGRSQIQSDEQVDEWTRLKCHPLLNQAKLSHHLSGQVLPIVKRLFGIHHASLQIV